MPKPKLDDVRYAFTETEHIQMDLFLIAAPKNGNGRYGGTAHFSAYPYCVRRCFSISFYAALFVIRRYVYNSGNIEFGYLGYYRPLGIIWRMQYVCGRLYIGSRHAAVSGYGC